MRIGFIEPHLRRFGGIRRVLELGNHLVDRGHEIVYYVPPDIEPTCGWMRCAGSITNLRATIDDRLDFVIYNNEPDWHYLESFTNADRLVFFALHFAQLYEKEGSWECLHKDVDLLLANSTWTADMIERSIGTRPLTFAGGINRDHFHPLEARKEYPILSVGDRRPWKGQDVINEAADSLGLPVETYSGKNLDQAEMAAEYAKAEVFVVGSDYEGFGQPGIEALACGTPLVTTNNGGCLDYAIDEETALVVPPRDSKAMADAIHRIRSDPALGARLREGGLRLVEERFSWSKSAAELESILDRAARREIDHRRGLGPSLRTPPKDPLISLVVLPWDQLPLTQRCVTSLRLHTDVPYELIIVDNGSAPVAQSYAAQAADVTILNPDNRGFAAGMNQGLDVARGQYVAFINNDTFFPPRWASRSLEAFDKHPSAGIVAPAVTAAANNVNVLQEPGERIYALPPFSAPPGAVVWIMPTGLARELGGFSEEYRVASGEDVDLGFATWVNGRDIVVDERVLVRHVSKGTAADKLDDWQTLWKENRDHFLDKWSDPEARVPHIEGVAEIDWHWNRRAAAAAASWMREYFRTRESLKDAERGFRAQIDAARQQEHAKLVALQRRHDRLLERRSVRFALGFARLFEPVIKAVRRTG